MPRTSHHLWTVALCIILCGCSQVQRAQQEEQYIAMTKAIKTLPKPELVALMERGHLSALNAYAGRYCLSLNTENQAKCLEYTMQAANLGHPHAMDQIAMFMYGENIPIYNPYEAYKWVWMESHFRREAYDFDSDLVRGFQKAGDKTDYTLMRFLERDLGPEKVAQARAEAEVKMKELAQKLEDYCEEWADEDYVCFYHLGQQPSYEQYEEEFYEHNGF